jgi:hypothetical protein
MMNPMAAAMIMQSMQSMGGMPGMRPPVMPPAGAPPGSAAAPKAEPATAGGGPGLKQEPGREGPPPGFDGRRYGGQEGRYERPDWEREREREGRFYDGPRGGGGPYRQAGAAAAGCVSEFTCSLLRMPMALSHSAMCKHWHLPQSACMLLPPLLPAGMGRHLTALRAMRRHTSGKRTHCTAAV